MRDVKTMQEKLSLRPELEPVVDWCMAWIREARRAVAIPTHKAMLLAWEAEKAKNPTDPFFNCLLTPKYAQDQCAVHWKHFLDYKKTLNTAAAAAAADAAAAAAEPPPSRRRRRRRTQRPPPAGAAPH
jgi:hypothetical protein